MQLFVELKKHLKSLGIEPNQKNLFAIENVIALILFVYCSGAIITYLLYEHNKTFFELGNAFFGVFSLLLTILSMLTNIIEQENLFNFIKNVEGIMENSKIFNSFSNAY